MKRIITLLIAILIGWSLNCFAQGKVSRPTKQQQTQTSKPKKSTPKVTVSEPDGYINGHGYVDLGLPSGKKWATCNIGAKSPYEAGDYFAWGETSTVNTIRGSHTFGKSKYELLSNGTINSCGSLTMTYDAAGFNWGEGWRMPIKEEFDELLKNCKWEWITGASRKGFKVIGPNANSIFFPAAGWGDGKSVAGIDVFGSYWSSTAYGDDEKACALFFCNISYDSEWSHRYVGYQLRPVSK